MIHRNSLHSEENFWPSVSDMFLTLFVIALVLYSTSSQEKGRGDAFIEAQTTVEACYLFSDLKTACPEDAVISAIDISAIEAQKNDKDDKHALLAEALMDVIEKSTLSDCFNLSTFSAAARSAARKNYRDAIDLAYRSVGCPPDNCPDYLSDTLREVHKALFVAMQRNHADSPTVLKGRLEAACARIVALEQQLQGSLMRSEVEILYRRIAELEKQLHHSTSEQSLLNRIAELETQLSESEAHVMRLKGELNKDTRRMVMGVVRKIVQENGAANEVQIEDDLGVIRIPTSSVGFAPDEYRHFSGETVMVRMSAILRQIAEANEQSKLIDNIVIECHADKSGDLFYNEELSSNRALYIWKFLNDCSEHYLEKYKNSTGLGLFSHAGFGCRVPVQLRPGENPDSREYKARCRRIDIRFNCTPVTADAGIE